LHKLSTGAALNLKEESSSGSQPKGTTMNQHTTLRTRGGRGRTGPVALGLLMVGLVAAIGTDGLLPAAWTQALLAALLLADVVAAEWLTRPRPRHA
jgi:hypothetical protein